MTQDERWLTRYNEVLSFMDRPNVLAAGKCLKIE